MIEHLPDISAAHFQPQTKERVNLPGRVGPILVGLIGLTLVACNLIPREPTTLAKPQIVFVTPTPGSEIMLNERQRFVASPPAQPTPQPAPAPYFAGANELGKVMVLEYHRIGYPEQRYQRTPENLRADLARLYQSGYYPVNFIDVIHGLPNVPPGKKPIVLTFDDSDISQFRVLSDRTIDADCALGILLSFHHQHPTDWPARATFFVLGNDSGNYYTVFGQSEWAKDKIQVLVDLGMEVGSHTASHADLSVATAERIYWELAVSQHVIEEMAPGYKVQSLSVPFGGFPFTLEFLKAGQWGNLSYTYAGNAAAWGGPNVSPFDSAFEPYHVSRLEVTATSLDHWLTYFEQNPQEYYVSDGDPNRVTFPQQVEIVAGN
ncbi:MAG: polysaccharide deacetylase family protein [Chloroflexi bacterium]|nr:polysaccharide deacetylase family protein [Chloroflexota bacterium]